MLAQGSNCESKPYFLKEDDLYRCAIWHRFDSVRSDMKAIRLIFALVTLVLSLAKETVALEERSPTVLATKETKGTAHDGRGIYVKMKNQIKSKMKSKIK